MWTTRQGYTVPGFLATACSDPSRCETPAMQGASVNFVKQTSACFFSSLIEPCWRDPFSVFDILRTVRMN